MLTQKVKAWATTNPWAFRIALSHDKFALVDEKNFTWLNSYLWFALNRQGSWYAVRLSSHGCRPFLIRMHRQITKCPPNKVVHHLNGDSLDNRRSNLLPCTASEHNFFH